MNKLRRALLGATLMMATGGLGALARPNHLMSGDRQEGSFENMIPREFGSWVEIPTAGIVLSDPTVLEKLSEFYSETLGRVYVDRSSNYSIMLSIAYGSRQTDALRVHSPEVCYPAQGFILEHRRSHVLTIGNRHLDATVAHTRKGNRIEPLLFWILVGDQIASSGSDRKIIQMKYGMKGIIPDGLLVRISSIDPEYSLALRKQEEFARDLYRALSIQAQVRVFGDST